MKITILGCGSSGGVPVLRYGWGDCDPGNIKNRRSRSSILIEVGNTSLLVDTSPDLRQQLLDNGIDKIDAVIFTHSHYDHVGGINELRPIFCGNSALLPIYATELDLAMIKKSHFYLFEENKQEIYRTYLEPHILYEKFSIGDISGITFVQDHGFSSSLGIRIGSFAYSTDVVSLSSANFETLKGIDSWVVGCQSLKDPKPTHAHLDLVLKWVSEISPSRTFLTHMGDSMDYETLLQTLPTSIRPAYDGMIIRPLSPFTL
ncbi:MAG: MBL fold metallo-hydrolase [Holosporaceae bacterium]|jgi:phosphoribosyl 1,2-cyclic phosphate phosphodiesterase|nr:MBL fold metallo-hydrolase [Holosporaceae bacterium]